MTFRPGDYAVWLRRKKGGRRPIVRVDVVVLAISPMSGNYVVAELNGKREAIVQPSSLEVPS